MKTIASDSIAAISPYGALIQVLQAQEHEFSTLEKLAQYVPPTFKILRYPYLCQLHDLNFSTEKMHVCHIYRNN